MITRLRLVVSAVLVATLSLSATVSALEKTAARLGDELVGGWRSATSATCLVDYYNICNGWIWIWSGWTPDDQIGTSFESCCADKGAEVDTSYVYFFSGAPAGYGYTGVVEIFGVDASNCPSGSALAAQSLLPTSGWNVVEFGSVIVPLDFAVTFTFGPGTGTPIQIATDHPDAGPTGAIACGTCYPNPRVNHSFYWGPTLSPLCPGSSFNDGVCDAEFLWDVSMRCGVAVESSSWGTIKGLYR